MKILNKVFMAIRNGFIELFNRSKKQIPEQTTKSPIDVIRQINPGATIPTGAELAARLTQQSESIKCSQCGQAMRKKPAKKCACGTELAIDTEKCPLSVYDWHKDQLKEKIVFFNVWVCPQGHRSEVCPGCEKGKIVGYYYVDYLEEWCSENCGWGDRYYT